MRPTVESGSVALSWTDATDPHAVVVGIPLPAVDAEYYEVSVTEELTNTLRTLAIALTICAAFTTVLGALLGRAASRRVLAPLGDVTSAAVRVSSGDLEARLGDTEDPDLVALVGAFNHMVDALHERIQQDARFAADVSHELRTPVTTLTTSLSLLQRAEGLTPQAVSAVQLMTDELARFRRALEDLLTLGQLDAGADVSDHSVTGVRELVRQALVASGRPVDLLVPDPRPLARSTARRRPPPDAACVDQLVRQRRCPRRRRDRGPDHPGARLRRRPCGGPTGRACRPRTATGSSSGSLAPVAPRQARAVDSV